MRDRKKRNIIIGSLCCLLVFMATGYAFFKQMLNINGTANLTGEWKIRISDISVHEVVGTATNVEDRLSFNDKEATFGVNLVKPGDKIVYKVTVVNEGNIDAVLSINSISSTHKDIKFTNTLASGEILYGSGSANGTTKLSQKEFYVTAQFNENATDVVSGEISEYKIELTYTQYDGNNFYEPPKDVETDNGVFQVSADGTILNYNANLGTHASIPAEIDGVEITSISTTAFRESEYITTYNYDFKTILDSSYMPVYAVIFKEEIVETLRQAATAAGFNAPMYVVGDPKIPEVNKSNGEIEAYYNMATGLDRFWCEGDADFLGESTTKLNSIGKLKIKSLDLSNATNLEYIDDFAFSNAYFDLNNEVVVTSSKTEEGLNSLTFGNNTKEIKLGLGVFGGANLDILKTYTTIRSEVSADTVGQLYLANKTKYINPFFDSKVNTLIIDGTETQKTINILEFPKAAQASLDYVPTYSMMEINNLYISDGITEIPPATFAEGNLKNVSLPNTLSTIGKRAFDSCKLTNIVIPKTVTFLGTHAFSNNPNMVITMKGRTNLDDIQLGIDGVGILHYGIWKDDSAIVNFE